MATDSYRRRPCPLLLVIPRPCPPCQRSSRRRCRRAIAGGSRTSCSRRAAKALGSNNWVVDGTLTASGKPLLANDPHLGTRLPSTWYLAHVKGGDFEVIGATLPGAPAVALGRNRFIAWGATNVAADVEDLYRERLDASGTHAEFRGAMEPVTVIPETIVVKGAAPLQIDVRVTRHGPLVSDAINANPPVARHPKPAPLEPLAFRWTALDADDTTLQSFLRAQRGAQLEPVHRRAARRSSCRRRISCTPTSTATSATTRQATSQFARSGDGSRPAEGWTGAAEWTGWIPFDDLPHLYDPPDHIIVTANHRPAPAAYRYHLGLEWPEPYRAQRIWDLLRAGGAGRAGGAAVRGSAFRRTYRVADRDSRRTTSHGSRPTRSRCMQRRSCRAARACATGHGAGAAGGRDAAWLELRCGGLERGGNDLRSVVPPTRARPGRRRARRR